MLPVDYFGLLLKEFRNILLGQQIKIYTDHKNLTYKHFNTERVMRWRLILEEFSPELIYIKGENNIVADALSRLDIQLTNDNFANYTDCLNYLAESYAGTNEDLSEDVFPITYKQIAKEQNKECSLLEKLRTTI